MIPLEYLNLLETRSCEHYGISVDADREIEEYLGLPTGTGLESVPIPLPQSPSQILYFTDSGADVPDVEVRASFSYLTKGNFNLGLQRSVLSLPFEFTANGEEWERTMVELRLTFSFLVHVYRAGVLEQFILRSRLTQTRVLLSPRMINPNDTTETRLLPETERLFVYPVKRLGPKGPSLSCVPTTLSWRIADVGRLTQASLDQTPVQITGNDLEEYIGTSGCRLSLLLYGDRLNRNGS